MGAKQLHKKYIIIDFGYAYLKLITMKISGTNREQIFFE